MASHVAYETVTENQAPGKLRECCIQGPQPVSVYLVEFRKMVINQHTK